MCPKLNPVRREGPGVIARNETERSSVEVAPPHKLADVAGDLCVGEIDLEGKPHVIGPESQRAGALPAEYVVRVVIDQEPRVRGFEDSVERRTVEAFVVTRNAGDLIKHGRVARERVPRDLRA